MKRFVFPGAAVLAIAGLCLAFADDKPRAAATGQAKKSASPAEKRPATNPAAAAERAARGTADEPAAAQRSPEEIAVRQALAGLVKAYVQHDGKAFASGFSADGEFIDEQGALYHGRAAIEEDFSAFFKENPKTTIEVVIESTRPIAPGVIAADGTTRFTRAQGEPPIAGKSSFICVKEGQRWFVASLREARAEPASHREQVRQLEWMLGEWIDEGADSHVHVTCRWDDSGNYLLRDFTVQQAGRKPLTGRQRIGYDPVTGRLKSWIFDSAGGFAEGYIHREGDSWVLHSSGVSSDGQMISGTNIFTRVDDRSMTWDALDRVVGGERIPDVEAITIVKRPPAPTARK